MNRSLTPIDISNSPELIRIAEEVRSTNTPRVLKRNSETVAILMPVAIAVKPMKKRAKTKADYAAFRSAAGSWKDIVDVAQFKKDIYESRKLSTRPAVKL